MHEAGFRALTRGEAIARLLPVGDTLILFHVHPDGDAVGSAFALRRMLEALGSRAYCVCADEIPDRLRFVTDGVQESALPESIPADFAVSRIVAVDTASPAQLGALYERFAGKIDLMLDHHEKGTPYADYYILPGISATGELLAGLLQEMQPALSRRLRLRRRCIAPSARTPGASGSATPRPKRSALPHGWWSGERTPRRSTTGCLRSRADCRWRWRARARSCCSCMPTGGSG